MVRYDINYTTITITTCNTHTQTNTNTASYLDINTHPFAHKTQTTKHNYTHYTQTHVNKMKLNLKKKLIRGEIKSIWINKTVNYLILIDKTEVENDTMSQ